MDILPDQDKIEHRATVNPTEEETKVQSNTNTTTSSYVFLYRIIKYLFKTNMF